MVLQITPSKSAKGAVRYFKDHLNQGDYMNADAVSAAVYGGRAAARLGLDGQPVDMAYFAGIKFNFDPRVVPKAEIERRIAEALRPPPDLDLDAIDIGTRVKVPHRGEGEIVQIDGAEVEVRLKDGKTRGETVFVCVNDLKSPDREIEIHPGERLTPRARKVTSYDFTFSAPKGVSLMYAVTGDERILAAFHASVDETMEEVEDQATGRVRRGSGDNQMRGNRRTGNLLWAGFTHETARPVKHADGRVTVDPHLHQHVLIDTVTYDSVEDRFKALNARAMCEHADYFQERTDLRLSEKLWELGYDVDRRGKSFDLTAVSPEVAAVFSGRTKEINDFAEKLGVTSDKAKGELGAKSRAAKSLAEDVDLPAHIQERAPEAFEALHRYGSDVVDRMGDQRRVRSISDEKKRELADAAVIWALDSALERQSTARYSKVAAEAARYAEAQGLSTDDVDAAFRRHSTLIWGDLDDDNRLFITTQEIVAQERALLKRVRDGHGARAPLIKAPRIDRDLSREQAAALSHVFSSQDSTIAIRGQAGTGKSFMLEHMDKELRRKRIFPVALAPTVAASRGALRDAGMTDANTLAKFLGNSAEAQRLRDKAKDGVIILDEAGLASVKDMLRLRATADDLNARVVLVGDTRQLSSVERGDALRLLEDHGLPTAELTEIRRQKNPAYKAVVEKVAEGKAVEGLRMAKEAGFVKEIELDEDALEPDERLIKINEAAAELAAKHVVAARKKGASIGVVCPTHDVGRGVSKVIRQQLQDEGLVGPDIATVPVYRQVNRTLAARQDAAHTLEEGDVAIMQRDDRDRGLAKDEVLIAKMDKRGKMHLHRDNWLQRRVTDGLDARAYNVYRKEEVTFGVGDQVMALEAIEDANLERKDVGVIRSISKNRRTITLEGGKKVSWDSGKLALGYAGTAPQLQGGSFDENVLVGTTSALPAISKKSLYVGISRGKEDLVIITDDFEALEGAVAGKSDRMHGIEVAKQAYMRELKAVDAELKALSQEGTKRPLNPFEAVMPDVGGVGEAPEPAPAVAPNQDIAALMKTGHSDQDGSPEGLEKQAPPMRGPVPTAGKEKNGADLPPPVPAMVGAGGPDAGDMGERAIVGAATTNRTAQHATVMPIIPPTDLNREAMEVSDGDGGALADARDPRAEGPGQGGPERPGDETLVMPAIGGSDAGLNDGPATPVRRPGVPPGAPSVDGLPAESAPTGVHPAELGERHRAPSDLDHAIDQARGLGSAADVPTDVDALTALDERTVETADEAVGPDANVNIEPPKWEPVFAEMVDHPERSTLSTGMAALDPLAVPVMEEIHAQETGVGATDLRSALAEEPRLLEAPVDEAAVCTEDAAVLEAGPAEESAGTPLEGADGPPAVIEERSEGSAPHLDAPSSPERSREELDVPLVDERVTRTDSALADKTIEVSMEAPETRFGEVSSVVSEVPGPAAEPLADARPGPPPLPRPDLEDLYALVHGDAENFDALGVENIEEPRVEEVDTPVEEIEPPVEAVGVEVEQSIEDVDFIEDVVVEAEPEAETLGSLPLDPSLLSDADLEKSAVWAYDAVVEQHETVGSDALHDAEVSNVSNASSFDEDIQRAAARLGMEVSEAREDQVVEVDELDIDDLGI